MLIGRSRSVYAPSRGEYNRFDSRGGCVNGLRSDDADGRSAPGPRNQYPDSSRVGGKKLLSDGALNELLAYGAALAAERAARNHPETSALGEAAVKMVNVELPGERGFNELLDASSIVANLFKIDVSSFEPNDHCLVP